MDNLFSGLVGSLLGVAISFFIYWHSQKVKFKRELIDKIDFLDYTMRYDFDGSCSVYKFIMENYLSLQSSTFVLTQYTFLSSRSELREAWYSFKGQAIAHKEEGYEYFKLPQDRDEAFKKLRNLRVAAANT